MFVLEDQNLHSNNFIFYIQIKHVFFCLIKQKPIILRHTNAIQQL